MNGGIHAFKKFKDLFRGSITFDHFWENRDRFLDAKMIISCTNSPNLGNYRAFYIILNIGTINYELKVVRDVESNEESHHWYELKRNEDITNLYKFVRSHINEIVPSPDISEIIEVQNEEILDDLK